MTSLHIKATLARALASVHGDENEWVACFITAAGLVVGNVEEPDPEADGGISSMIQECVSVHTENNAVISEPVFVELSNVTLYLNSGIEKQVPHMLLFVDQIIGVTLQIAPSVG